MVSAQLAWKVRQAVSEGLPCTCQFYGEDMRVGPCPRCDLEDGIVFAVMRVLMTT